MKGGGEGAREREKQEDATKHRGSLGFSQHRSTYSSLLKWGGRAAAGMWTDAKAEVGEASGSRASIRRRVLNSLLLCAGDMGYLDKYMQGRKTLTMHCYFLKKYFFLSQK